MSAHLEFDLTWGPAPKGRGRREGDEPLRLLVLGSFTGRAAEGEWQPRVQRVDVDSFDSLFERFAPTAQVELDHEAGTLGLEFREREDFHPDALFDRVALFAGLRETRKRLKDPATFAEAAQELGAPAKEADEPSPESNADTLNRLLGARPVQPSTASGTSFDLTKLLRSVVAPDVTAAPTQHQKELVQSTEAVMVTQMRAILHHPDVQRLEATWTSLHSLVTGVETGPELQIFLLDATREELAADLSAAASDPARSRLYRKLVEEGVGSPGGQPWSLMVGDYRFGEDASDLALLEALGRLASHAGGPFLAEASPRLLGCESFAAGGDAFADAPADQNLAERWQGLRHSPAAPWIGLAAPRILVRAPYGERGEEIDRFPFEERDDASGHEQFLWGNPAFACAQLIATAFTERGWNFQPGDHLGLDGLPLHTYEDQGEMKMLATAEAWLPESAGDRILRAGLMPILSVRGQNAVRLLRMQSVAEPASALAGPWS